MPTDVTFTRLFADLPDPRVTRTRKHRLDDILAIALCAVICGADRFEEIERFGEGRQDGLTRFLALPHDVPSHDTFNRVLAALARRPRWRRSGGRAGTTGWRWRGTSRPSRGRSARRSTGPGKWGSPGATWPRRWRTATAVTRSGT
jgi:hypothetical protein